MFNLRFFTLSISATLFAVVTSTVQAVEYEPATVPLELEQIAEHSWYVKGKPGIATDNQGFISNAGVVITDEGIVVVDALGTPSLAHKLLGEIRKISDKPIVKVIVAHYHADHILGLQVYKDLGAEVVAPTGSEKYLNSDVSTNRLEERRVSLFPWVDEDTRLVFPDRYIDKGESFQLGGVTIQLTMVGDVHSDADLMVYVENDRVLYSGDVIFEGRIPFVGSANTKHWLKVLQEMERKELAALVPGHGRVKKAPIASIGFTSKYLAYMREHLGAAVDELIPFAEAYDSIDWGDYIDMVAFEEANRRNAYQVFISLEEELLAGE